MRRIRRHRVYIWRWDVYLFSNGFIFHSLVRQSLMRPPVIDVRVIDAPASHWCSSHWCAWNPNFEDLVTPSSYYAQSYVSLINLTLTTLKYLCINYGNQRVFSIWNHHKCLSYLFLYTYVMGLQPPEIFYSFIAGIVYWRQILTFRFWRKKSIPALIGLIIWILDTVCFSWYLKKGI